MAIAIINEDEGIIGIETDLICAQIRTRGYVSGVAAGTFLDKKTGAKDLGFGLDIVDFLLEPGAESERSPWTFLTRLESRQLACLAYRYERRHYIYGDKIHGNIPKRYIELPQICVEAKQLPFEVIRGENFVAVKQWFRWTIAGKGRKPGSLWEQWLIFPDGKRYFYAYDSVISANDVDQLILRLDMPGHLKHSQGDSFRQIYLSYYGYVPASEFRDDFAPDEKFFYQRGKQKKPQMIRAYQTKEGLWLAGMALDPNNVYEAWCHQRGYVCFIEEVGGFHLSVGGRLDAAHIIGWFDDVEEMSAVYDAHRNVRQIKVDEEKRIVFT